MRRNRPPKIVKMSGPTRPGVKVLRQAPPDRCLPRHLRFYNPDGKPFEVDVLLTPFVLDLLREGDIKIGPSNASEPSGVRQASQGAEPAKAGKGKK